jgi:alcohol dehydrogenase
LPEFVRSLGGHKAFVVTDPGVQSSGIVDRVTAALIEHHIGFDVYDRVTADSGSRLIREAVDGFKSAGADVVVGIGGGSALDTAKAVGALATNHGSPLEYAGLHKLRNRPFPVIALPTTAGTGSEVSLWSVFTDDDRKLKVAIGGVQIYPAVALCDPELTIGLPASLTASTGMDALAHAIECYTNKACQPISGALALKAIELIGTHLPRAWSNGTDREARYAVLLGSTLAGMAMNPTRLGLAHALAMPLGSWDLKIPHSLAIAVTLAPVMRFNCCAAVARFADVAGALGYTDDGAGAQAAADQAPSIVRNLAQAIGIPKRLSEYGLRENHVPAVIEEAMKSGNVTVNPRETTKDQLSTILRSVL